MGRGWRLEDRECYCPCDCTLLWRPSFNFDVDLMSQRGRRRWRALAAQLLYTAVLCLLLSRAWRFASTNVGLISEQCSWMLSIHFFFGLPLGLAGSFDLTTWKHILASFFRSFDQHNRNMTFFFSGISGQKYLDLVVSPQIRSFSSGILHAL